MFRRNQHAPLKGDPGYGQWRKSRRGLRIRRTIAVSIILGMLWGGFWLIKYSGFADPVLVQIQPAVTMVQDIFDDPKKAFFGFAVLFISHIGMIAYIFDEI